jgi:hypothetical protein
VRYLYLAAFIGGVIHLLSLLFLLLFLLWRATLNHIPGILLLCAGFALTIWPPTLPTDLHGWRHWSEIVIGILVLLAIGWTTLMRVFVSNEATLSAVLFDLSREWPMIALFFGAIVGHVFWPTRFSR